MHPLHGNGANDAAVPDTSEAFHVSSRLRSRPSRPTPLSSSRAVWHVTHREHNRLMHALHGNGSAPAPVPELATLHGTVLKDFHGLVDALEERGLLRAWLADDDTSCQAVRNLRLSVRARAKKRPATPKEALKTMVEAKLEGLAKEIRKHAAEEEMHAADAAKW